MRILLLGLANSWFYFLIVISFLGLSLYWFYRIFYSKKWVQGNQFEISNIDNTETFFVIIPVLNEEKLIRETSEYFLNLLKNYSNFLLVFVTTVREEENTVEIIKELANKNNRICHFHYTGDGVMAHQLNYAVKKIAQYSNEDNFIAVYNADSRPHKETFDYIFSNKNLNKINVFQQYGNYTANLNTFSNNFFTNSILTASAGWQNRWILGIELFRAIKQFNYNIIKPLNYCIGHGFFIRQKTLKKVGGFCETTHNEDSVMGFILSNIGEWIHPIPYFDYSESPNLVLSLFIQKSNWFFGPSQFYDYYKIVKSNNLYKNYALLIFFTLQMMSLAVYWIVGPTFLFVLFLLSFSGLLFFVVFLIVYVVFLVVPNYISIITINSLDGVNIKFRKLIIFKVFLGSLPAYLMHGASGYVGLFKYLISKILKKNVKKHKTYIKH